MTVFNWLLISSFFARFARLLGVCLLGIAVVAGRATAAEETAAPEVPAAATLVDRAVAGGLSAEDTTGSEEAPSQGDFELTESGDSSEEEESDEGDQQAEEALQTRDSLWLACSSYELTFLSSDKRVGRCLQVDPGPARV